MGDEDQGFNVRDRRRFDAEGRMRDDVEADDARDREPESDAPATEPSRGAGPFPPVDFSTFLLSLSTSAMVHLGEAPSPEGATQQNLQLAQQVIDILAMLEQKTEGNRTAEESKLVEQLLYDLRLRYVHATKQ